MGTPKSVTIDTSLMSHQLKVLRDHIALLDREDDIEHELMHSWPEIVAWAVAECAYRVSKCQGRCEHGLRTLDGECAYRVSKCQGRCEHGLRTLDGE